MATIIEGVLTVAHVAVRPVPAVGTSETHAQPTGDFNIYLAGGAGLSYLSCRLLRWKPP